MLLYIERYIAQASMQHTLNSSTRMTALDPSLIQATGFTGQKRMRVEDYSALGCDRIVTTITGLPMPGEGKLQGNVPQELLDWNICYKNVDIHVYIWMNGLLLEMENALKNSYTKLLWIIHQKMVKLVDEKEIELENVKCRNAKLEEKILDISAEKVFWCNLAQNNEAEKEVWCNLAQNNEAKISSLKKTLEHVLLWSTNAALIQKEGYGDTDEKPLEADESSSCF